MQTSTPTHWSQTKRQLEPSKDTVPELLSSLGHSIKRPRSGNFLPSESTISQDASFPSNLSIEAEICFGMLVDIPIQLDVSRMKSSLASHETEHGRDKYIHLDLVIGEDRCEIQIQGSSVATMNMRSHLSLKSMSKYPLRYVGLCSREKINSETAIHSKASSHGSSPRTSHMAILVFGPRSASADVAKDLSRRHLFLQHPYPMTNELPYENPQYLDMVGSSFTNGSILAPIPMDLSTTGSNQINEQEDTSAGDLALMMENLPNFNYSPDVQIDQRIQTPLLNHQKEAVNFVAQREAVWAEKRQGLWKIEHDSVTKSLFYQHLITGSKSPTPDDVPGGILADGMGLGKTLTMIAVIVKSLARAEEFAKTLKPSPAPGSLPLPVQSTLVIVPSTLLMDGWIEEIKKHVVPNGITLYRYHGPNRKLPSHGLQYHIVFSTYGTVSSDFHSGGGILQTFHWYRLILDEAHTIRNSTTKQFNALTSLSASIRWCMTGTVIQNTLDDLASLVRFLRVPNLDDPKTFRRYISGKKKTSQGVPKPDYTNLKLLLRSICFGRNTSLVLNNLGVTFIERRPCFSATERKRYEELAISCGRSIKEAVNGPSARKATSRALTAVLRLRIFCNTGVVNPIDGDDDDDLDVGRLQPDEMLSLYEQDGNVICVDCSLPVPEPTNSGNEGEQSLPARSRNSCQRCSGQAPDTRSPERMPARQSDASTSETVLPIRGLPAQIPQAVGSDLEWVPAPSSYPSKIKALLEDVKEHYSASKCIIFSFWRRSLDLIDKIFCEEGIIFGRIDSHVPDSQRKRILAEFKEKSSVRVLLMTVGTGSAGLNDLSVASRLHILEPQWNPSVESQAIGRVFRLGQQQRVHVIRYIMENTLEESIESRQIVKIQLASKSGLQSSNREDSERQRRAMYLRALGRMIESTTVPSASG